MYVLIDNEQGDDCLEKKYEEAVGVKWNFKCHCFHFVIVAVLTFI